MPLDRSIAILQTQFDWVAEFCQSFDAALNLASPYSFAGPTPRLSVRIRVQIHDQAERFKLFSVRFSWSAVDDRVFESLDQCFIDIYFAH
ncbi:hypothetical protein Plhal304r1_c035g0109041 [Plasmopara halstedii]